MCVFVSSFAMAGNTAYSRYGISSRADKYWYEAPSSYNTKATTKANWFMNIEKLDFGGGKTSGTWGMGYTPLINGSQAGDIHWSLTTHSSYAYTGWGSYNGAAGNKYLLGVRLDTLVTGAKSAYTVGWWNSY